MTSKQLITSIAVSGSLIAGGIVNDAHLQAQDAAINPYVENVDTFEARVQANKVLIHKNEPKITLEKWNNKDSLSVSYSKKKANGKSNRKQLTKIIEYNVNAKESVVMEPTDDGFNIDINLSSKPTSNVFIYQFDNWQDKDFFYQPALNVEMASSTCTETDCGNSHRPENVVGSYAVYSKEKKNHITGQTNYQTGKLFHIYRPLVSDANGSTTWATLNISDGVMTVAVPWEFLDSASYPVLVDPTFGYTTAGGTFTSGDGKTLYFQATPASAGDITLLTCYIDWNFAGSGEFPTAIYSDNAGNPNSRLVSNPLITKANGADWASTTVSLTITATPYHFGIYSASARYRWYYDTGLGGVSNEDTTTTSLPATATPGGTSTGRTYSIYATYTADTPVSASTTLFNIQSGTVKINSGKVIR